MHFKIYEKKTSWKIALFITATIIVAATLLYTSRLAGNIATEELQRVQQIADVYEYISTAENIEDYGFFIDLIQSNKSVPIISTNNEGDIIAFLNLDSIKAQTNKDYLIRELQSMKNYADPIRFEISDNTYQYIYFKHSYLYTQLRYYPIIQLFVIAAFLIFAYVLFNTARKSEQNRVWVGMAKETAHQLGTPISSLVAWVDYLKESGSGLEGRQNIIDEMEKDVKRLELIADRFSKVGSLPDLVPRNIVNELENSIDYIKRRSSKKVQFDFIREKDDVVAKLNPTLFNWVIENILKNALDAIDGNGKIEMHLMQTDAHVIIDIHDSGKGIPRAHFKTVFEPGFSTKKRGWGLGLTLAKRIVENYHGGRIFVKSSVAGKGTTFRIMLPVT